MVVLGKIWDSLSSLLQFWTCPNDLCLSDAKINYYGAWRDWEVVIRGEEECNWMNFAFGSLSGKLGGGVEVGGR